MRRAIFPILMLLGITLSPALQAQSTISNEPFELSTGQGLWGAFLPAYELGTNANGAPAFRDNLDDVGYHGDIKAVRRFLGTRTSFEGRVFFGHAQSKSTTDPIAIDVTNPISGVISSLSGSGTSLKSKVDNYGFDLTLRDTWRTRFGGLSAGCAFSYIGFDQTFDVNYGSSSLMREKLDSDYRGGKGFVGWDGCICGRATNIDFLVGVYDMNAKYDFSGGTLAGAGVVESTKTTTTIETNITTRQDFRKLQLGATLGVMYFSDMPTIEHNVGAPVTLGTDDAVSLKLLFEILL